MKYRLVTNKSTEKKEGDVATLIEDMKALGFAHTGFNHNPQQREELQGQPKFEDLAGPMWDGDAIRYEDWASYEILSQ